MSKFYDPLGLVSPITIKNKILLMQKAWQSTSDWDNPYVDFYYPKTVDLDSAAILLLNT